MVVRRNVIGVELLGLSTRTTTYSQLDCKYARDKVFDTSRAVVGIKTIQREIKMLVVLSVSMIGILLAVLAVLIGVRKMVAK